MEDLEIKFLELEMLEKWLSVIARFVSDIRQGASSNGSS